MIIVERVIVPRNETLGLIIVCILDGSCDQTTTTNDGEKTTNVQSRLQAKLAQLEADESGKFLSVLTHSRSVLEDGYQKALLKAVTAKLFKQELSDKTASQAVKVVPIIGWVDAAASTVKAVDKAPQEIRMASYLTNATAMISLWGTYRVYADEIKSGNVDPAIMGSFINTLGAGQPNDIGGSASAEESPLYQKLIDGKLSTSTKYRCADGGPVPKGQPVCTEEVTGGNLSIVGSLEAIRDSSWFKAINGLAGFWNSTIAKPIRAATKAFSRVGDFLLTHTPGYNQLVSHISSAAQPLADAFVNKLVPSPFGNVRGSDSPSNDSSAPVLTLMDKLASPVYAADEGGSDSGYMSGGRVFNLIAGGADASGNEYAHNGLGAKTLTPEQSAAIINEQLDNEYQQYKSQPLLTRLFDTNSEYSPVSKLALAMPATKADMLRSIGSILTNPIAKLSSVFGSLFSPHRAFAAASAAPDPFGIPQYGYPSGDATLAEANKDPENYWSKNCSSDGTTIDWKKPVNAKWQDAGLKADETSSTGMPENASTNPCLLLQATVGSAGGLFDESLVAQDQPGALPDTSTGSGLTGTSDTTSTAEANIDMAHIYDSSTSVACAPGTNDLGTQDGYYQGRKVPIKACAIPGLPSGGEESNGGYGVSGANGLAIVNSRVSGAVLAMVQAAKKDGVSLAANSSFRTMAHQEALCPCDGVHVARPGTSNHQMGLAIDFSTLPSTPGPVSGNAFWNWLSANAAKYGYKNYPAEAWHWSPTGN